MKWTSRGRSQNLEDRRSARPRIRLPGQTAGAGIPLPRGRGSGISVGSIVLLLVVMWLLGVDPMELLGALSGGATGGGSVQVPIGPGGFPDGAEVAPGGNVRTTPQEEELVDFVSFVLDDVQSVWQRDLPGYADAKLVLFRDWVESACGFAQAAMGPFYCPSDQKVYIDLGFYEELRQRFGAPGDFAQAYVLAHEIGHHVQRLTGIEERVRRAQRSSPGAANALSVRMELQADCYAGVWAHSTARRDLLEAGDLEEGLQAAAAVGDDRIQRMSAGRVAPESFTHGSSKQRMGWFQTGFETGDPEACDTFSAPVR
jgi:predicted metalloprotease